MLPLDWSTFDGYRFQDLCLELLANEGYAVQDQGIGPDGGVDAILIQPLVLVDDDVGLIRWATQFKFKKNPNATVKPQELGNVENLLGRFRAEGFLLVTNGRITSKTFAELRGTLTERHPRYFLATWARRHLEQRITTNENIAARYFGMRQAVPEPKYVFEIAIALPPEAFSLSRQRLQLALASYLEISAKTLTVRELSRDGTKVLVEAPDSVARRLRDASINLSPGNLGFKFTILSVSELTIVKPPVLHLDFRHAPSQLSQNEVPEIPQERSAGMVTERATAIARKTVYSLRRATKTSHLLPLDRLAPLDFERLCLWLIEREGYERAEHRGAAGSEGGRCQRSPKIPPSRSPKIPPLLRSLSSLYTYSSPGLWGLWAAPLLAPSKELWETLLLAFSTAPSGSIGHSFLFRWGARGAPRAPVPCTARCASAGRPCASL